MALVEHLVGSVVVNRTVLTKVAVALLVQRAVKARGARLPTKARKLRQTLRLGDLRLELSVALAAVEVKGVLMITAVADARLQIDATTAGAVVAVEDAGRLGF